MKIPVVLMLEKEPTQVEESLDTDVLPWKQGSPRWEKMMTR